MMEKIRRVPHPGLRNIKTAIAAVMCILLYEYTGRTGVILAVIASFICMQDSVDKSLLIGRDRILGTILGGLFGCVTAYLEVADMHIAIFASAMFVGIVLFIFICSNLLKMRNTIIIGLCTYLIIVFESRINDIPAITHALDRTLDTVIGILIAFVTNVLLFRPHPERFRGHDTVNPVFHYEYRKGDHHKTVRWKNGESKELYIYPENAIFQELDFDFRVSYTHVFGPSNHFRLFPGYKRTIMALDENLCIHHEGEHDVTLGKYEQESFFGDWDTHGRGKGRDLSIVTGKGLDGSLELMRHGDRMELDNGHFISFFSLSDGVKIYLTNQGRTFRQLMDREDYIVVSWYENGAENFTVEVKHEDEAMADEPLVIMASCDLKPELRQKRDKKA